MIGWVENPVQRIESDEKSGGVLLSHWATQ
jgi:hypothetical protein